MSQHVVIKSYQKGLSIYLDESIPMDELRMELSEKFRESSKFFGEAKMVVNFENRVLSEEEEKNLITIIENNSKVHVCCLVGKNEDTDKLFVKALEQMEVHTSLSAKYAQVYRGNLKDGQCIECSNSVILLGDVYPGCKISSDKDIYIYGALYGEAKAGGDGESGHFVAALEMSPEKLKINGFRYISKEKSKWSIKPKTLPKIAVEKEGDIVCETITRELMDELTGRA